MYFQGTNLAQNVPAERTAILIYFLPTKCSYGTIAPQNIT